jgi:hypothetical protein
VIPSCVTYMHLRMHYDLWALQPEDVREIQVGEQRFSAAADAMRLIGDSQRAQGHYEQAILIYQHALAILPGLGEEHQKTGAILK